jgi:hypothetical protein
MTNPTLDQVFEVLNKHFELAYGRDNHQICELINVIQSELLDIAEN